MPPPRLATAFDSPLQFDDREAPFGPIRLATTDAPSLVTIGRSADPLELRRLDPTMRSGSVG